MRRLDKDLLKKNITDAAEYDLSRNNIKGCSYKVMQNGETIAEEYFGEAGENTIFRLASMTKPITAAAILILVDRGLLELSEEAESIVPELCGICVNDRKNVTEPDTKISVMHLLTHSAGFGVQSCTDITAKDMETIEDTIKYYVKKGLAFSPFTSQMYSGVGAFDVLSAIVQRVTGEKYADFLKKEIFTPCGMTDTGFAPTDSQKGRIIPMHQRIDGENAVFEMRENCIFENFPWTHDLGGAGLFSTLADYSKFAGMLVSGGISENGRILSENAVKLLGTPFVPKEIMPRNERWGLGVRVITEEEYGVLPTGTFGWSGAYGSHFWVDRENGVTAVFMKNSKFDGGSANASARRFESAVFEAFV